jgi:hypothetical protein
VNIFGEISCIKEFNEDNLYLFYEFSLPLGWKVDNENEYYLIYKSENLEEENINKLKSISPISQAYVQINKEETKTNESDTNGQQCLVNNLCLPFELELLCHDSILEQSSPKLLLQVNSVDSFNRHRIEGYCFLNIPIKTGFYQYDIPCYKPREDNYMKVFSFFLGGSRKIPDLKEIARTSSKNESNIDSALNRYGIYTEYSGKVCLNLNVVLQSKNYLEESRNKLKEKQGREAYNIIETIENHVSQRVDYEINNSLMQTKSHGVINRFSK